MNALEFRKVMNVIENEGHRWMAKTGYEYINVKQMLKFPKRNETQLFKHCYQWRNIGSPLWTNTIWNKNMASLYTCTVCNFQRNHNAHKKGHYIVFWSCDRIIIKRILCKRQMPLTGWYFEWDESLKRKQNKTLYCMLQSRWTAFAVSLTDVVPVRNVFLQ